MRGEFIFRDERNQPAALPSLKKWQELTSVPFARRPRKLVEADALYAKFVLAQPGSFASLQTAVMLKGVLNAFFSDASDVSKARRINAGGGAMQRLFQALAEFTGELALPPCAPDESGVPPSAHAHARFGILWVLANLKIGFSPGVVIGGSLAGIDAALGLARGMGPMTNHTVLPHYNQHTGFAFEQAIPYLDGGALPASSGGKGSLAANLRAEIVNMVRGFIASLWEDIKRTARFFVQPSWKGFADIGDRAIRYIVEFVQQVPAYVAPAYTIVKRLGKVFDEFRHKRNRHLLLGRFEAATGHIADYIEAIRKDTNAVIVDHGITVLVTGALMGLNFAMPVITALAGPIVRIILWATNALRRLVEKIRLDAFLTKARGHFDAEPRLGEGPLRFQPAQSGGLVHDAAKFNAFFRDGYQASPVVPFLTMNTGVCGDLLTKVTFKGDPADTANETAYLAALTYFDQARELSQRYLRKTGFVFGTMHDNAHVQRVIRLAIEKCDIQPDEAPLPSPSVAYRASAAGSAVRGTRGTRVARPRAMRAMRGPGAPAGSPKAS